MLYELYAERLKTCNFVFCIKDLNDDVCGAMNIGMKGILVKTGKYIANIEATAKVQPTRVCDSFAAAVDWLIQEQLTI